MCTPSTETATQTIEEVCWKMAIVRLSESCQRRTVLSLEAETAWVPKELMAMELTLYVWHVQGRPTCVQLDVSHSLMLG
jgi:hypothetical protein